MILTGRILDLTDLTPVSGSVIKIKKNQESRFVIDISDFDGRYVLVGLSPGVYKIIITAANYKRVIKNMLFNGIFNEKDFFLIPIKKKP
jgi:hypothetical protein